MGQGKTEARKDHKYLKIICQIAIKIAKTPPQVKSPSVTIYLSLTHKTMHR